MTQPFDIVTDPDVIARREARAKEYGKWECGPSPIEFNGARAFNEGDPVPTSTVERFALDAMGRVVPAGTHAKAQEDAEAARAEAESKAVAAMVAESNESSKPAKKNTAAAKNEGGN